MKRKLCVSLFIAAVFATPALAVFKGNGGLGSFVGDPGASDWYISPENWEDGIIDNSFEGVTFPPGTYYVRLDTPWTITNDWNISYASGNLILNSGGVNAHYTLEGDIIFTNIPGAANPALSMQSPALDLVDRPYTFWLDRGLTIDGPISGGHGITVVGAGGLNFRGTSTFPGKLTRTRGTVTLGGNPAGDLLGVEEIRTVNPADVPSGTVTIAADIDRPNGYTQRTGTDTRIVLENYRWDYQDAKLNIHGTIYSGRGDKTLTNGIGTVVFSAGFVTITHGYSHGWIFATSNFFMRTEGKAIERKNRAAGRIASVGNARDFITTNETTLAVTGTCAPPLGAWRTAQWSTEWPFPGGNRFVLEEAPWLVGGDGATLYNQPIVPYLFGNDPNFNHDLNTGSSLLTYNHEEGFRGLRVVADIEGNPPEFYVDDITLAGADYNVRLTSNQTLTASKTINSIMATDASVALSLDPGVVLTLASGVLRARVVPAVAGDTTCAVNFGDMEGFVYTFVPAVPLTGTNGVTFVAQPHETVNQWILGTGGTARLDAYSGQTTFTKGQWVIYNRVWPVNLARSNIGLPDEDFVLVHPSAVLRVGDSVADYCTREIIGGLGGLGEIRLGLSTAGFEARHSTLTIGSDTSPHAPADYWETWTNSTACVRLDGGLLKPGMTEDKRGALRFTTAASTGTPPFPVELRNGTFAIAIDKDGNNDSIAVQGELIIGYGNNLYLDVTLEEGADITAGKTWTIATAGSIDAASDRLFRKVLCNDPKWTFEVEAVADTLVMTAERTTQGTLMLIR